MINSNKTHITISISDLIISEGLPLNLPKKPIFKKIMDLEKKVTKTYITPKINIISEELLDFIHEKNMKRNLATIKKEAEISGLLFSRR